MATTLKYSLRYPNLSGAPTQVPQDIENLANDIEAIMAAAVQTVSGSRPTTGKSGRLHYATDTGVISYDTGSSWITVGVIDSRSADIAASAPGDTAAAGSTGLAADAGHRHPREAYASALQGTAALTTYTESLVDLGNTGASKTVDLSTGRAFKGTLTANTTFTFSNAPTGTVSVAFALYLKQDATGSRIPTWPASVDWGTAGSPTLTTTANKLDIVAFTSIDNGTTWLGRYVGAGF